MNDEWLEAVCQWTEEVLGNDWTVYGHEWPETIDDPAMLWAISGADSASRGGDVLEVRKLMHGSLVGSVAEIAEAAVAIVTKAGQAVSLATSDSAAPVVRLADCAAEGLTGDEADRLIRLTAVGLVRPVSPSGGGPLMAGVVRQALIE